MNGMCRVPFRRIGELAVVVAVAGAAVVVVTADVVAVGFTATVAVLVTIVVLEFVADTVLICICSPQHFCGKFFLFPPQLLSFVSMHAAMCSTERRMR